MDISKLFMNVPKEQENAFLGALKTNGKAYTNKIIFVEGAKSNYIVVNGAKYGEFNTSESFNIDNIIPVSSYDSMAEALSGAVNSDPVYLPLAADMKIASGKYIEIKDGADVTIDLSGHDIDASQAPAAFVIRKGGKLHIVGDGEINAKSIAIQNSGEVVVDGGVFKAVYPVYVMSDSSITINGGEFESVEGCISISKAQFNSTTTINGGKFTAADNAVIMDNGTKDQCSGHKIVINGGEFTGNIKSDGYIACGIYLANDNELYVNGGKFTINGGCGILARAGRAVIDGATFDCTGTTLTGWVGDSKNEVECAPVVFDEAAKYPGLTENSEIVVREIKMSSECKDTIVDSPTKDSIIKYCWLHKNSEGVTIHDHNGYATRSVRINIR